MEAPWNLVKNRIGGAPSSVTMIESVEQNYLDKLVNALPTVETAVGIGGGVSIHVAKYFAWRRGCSLIFVPTIVSVNAYATRRAAVRENGVVKYLPQSRTLLNAEKVIIDFPSIMAAPSRLNIAGVGDIYSCRTALFDWQLAHRQTGESYDEEIARGSRSILERLLVNRNEIRNVTEKGIRVLVELHRETNRLIMQAGKSRPEEGSEHIFFYTLEELTRRNFVHGEVVGLGIFVASYFQSNGQEEDDVASTMDSLGLLFRPKDIGVGHDEFVQAVLNMRRHSKETKRFFSIVDMAEISESDAELLWKKLSA
jgi:glycerol-1-phosphate dehydrogenase [NAD(P)+]